MSKVVARLELVLAWTLQSEQKHIGRATFVEKAWSLFLINTPKGHITSPAKKLGQSGGMATTCQQVVLHTEKTKLPILKTFTFSELKSATRNCRPDMLLGEGSFGRVFKGWLDSVTFDARTAGDGLAVAIKRLNQNSRQGLIEWEAEVKFLGTFSHPNVVKLFGYCQENKELLLVYEYMQKGSLESHLFKKVANPLPWETRIKIAKGAAQGLAFLHATENNVIYRDVKSSNILLDGEFNPKLSDFGLAKFGAVSGESHVSTCLVGTYGYAAPEYIATGHLYVKSDIYGFGVVMLEMITRLRVLDNNRPTPNQNLVDWARPYLTNVKKLRQIMDPRLEHVYPQEGAMKVAKLIRNCLEEQPIHRPSMVEVAACLEEINSIKIKTRQVKRT